MPDDLTPGQMGVRRGLLGHGQWNPDAPMWFWHNTRATRQNCDALVRKGYATVDANGIYRPTDKTGDKP